jgi:putative toxin-antitoxin system antitoxin component (TIGR02293 family)
LAIICLPFDARFKSPPLNDFFSLPSPKMSFMKQAASKRTGTKKRTSYSTDVSADASQSLINDGAAPYAPGLSFWLGGAAGNGARASSDFDVIQLARKGITKAAIDYLAAHLGITKKAIAEDIFDISVKTLERKAPADVLDKKTSSHALEIARVMAHALTVFGDEEKTRRWVNKPNRALNQMAPIALFDTLTGLNLVNDILGRLEEGVYSSWLCLFTGSYCPKPERPI